jgi:alpha-2-macroglobulin
VTPERSEVLQGEFITFTVQANYFFGGPVSDAPVKWSVLSRNYVFDRYRGQERFVWTDATIVQAATDERPLASGEGRTDATGQLHIIFPANLADKVQSQVFSLEAAVTDLNDQESASRAEVIVHQSMYYIGLSSDHAIAFAGQPMTVSVQTVDWQGVASGSHPLDLTLVKREWFNVQEQDRDGHVQWTWSFSDTAIMTTSLTTTAQGQAQVTFIPPEGGQYYVRASSADQVGRTVRASTWRWVSSHSFISWRRENTDCVPLIADQAAYQPGEIAHLQIQSPYQVGTTPPRALITVERGRILYRQIINLKSNSEVVDIPITPEMAPQRVRISFPAQERRCDQPSANVQDGLYLLHRQP